MSRKRPSLPSGPVLMGIVNVTPDSFSDGGRLSSVEAACGHAMRLAEEGAAILDIGGESTRPGSRPVGVQEEMDRVLPVIETLSRATPVMLSVDTRHAATMRAALDAGAGMVNDVSALRHDPDALAVVAGSGCLVCLMHMQGEPQTMQDHPTYIDVVAEVAAFLQSRVDLCLAHGVDKARLLVDPGIGFGKSLAHNLALLRALPQFDAIAPVLLGASRKGFIGALDPLSHGPQDRLGGSVAMAIHGARRGVKILRVHDVAATRQAIKIWQAVADDDMGGANDPSRIG